MELDDDDLLYEHWRQAGGGGSRRYTHLLTGISVSQSSPMSHPVGQIHAELRRQLAEKVACHFASRSAAGIAAMGSHERPYLLACTVPTSEYSDRVAVTQYVWRYCSEFLTSLDRRVGSYTRPILGSDDDPKVQKIWLKLNLEYGTVPDAAVERAFSNGRDEYMDNVCDRLLREHADEIFVNRCPSCDRVLRTPRAKQCSWCKRQWHSA